MSKGSKRNKSQIKKRKPPVLTADDYAGVLNELGPNVECAADCGEVVVILIKPARRNGRKVILTMALGFQEPGDKEPLREISKQIRGDDGWTEWEV